MEKRPKILWLLSDHHVHLHCGVGDGPGSATLA